MKARYNRHALACITLGALLAGCGGTTNAISAPGVVPQGIVPQVSTHASHAKSWMLPEASGEDLLYVSGQQNTNSDGYALFVYDLQSLQQVGAVNLDGPGYGLCNDARGDIYVTEEFYGSGGGYGVVEYKHATTSPSRTIIVSGYAPLGCSIDPSTGDLAVSAGDGRTGALLVYRKAKGTPRVYGTRSDWEPFSTAYGPHSENFIQNFKWTYNSYYSAWDAQYRFDALFAHSKKLEGFGLPLHCRLAFGCDGNDLAWDGTYLVVLAAGLVRYEVHGLKVKEAGVVIQGGSLSGATEFSIVPKYGQVFITGDDRVVTYFGYPSGTYEGAFFPDAFSVYGITSSLAGTRAQ